MPPVSWPRRLRLGTEILVVYARAKRSMKRTDIRSAIAAVREGGRTRRRPGPVPTAEAVRLGWAVTKTLSTLPLDDRCLAQSLVLTGLLARRQTPNTLVIGARPGADFGAHAWIEVDGVPVLATDDATYPRLVEL